MIFRKTALERMSSPEQLDQLLQMAKPRGLLSLAALVGLILAALYWGFTGSIPTEARGDGILIRRGGVADVVASAQGQVDEVLVEVGDVVTEGQVLARVRQEELTRRIEENQARLLEIQGKVADVSSFAEQQIRLKAQNLEQRRANLERSIASLETEIALLRERVAADKALLEDGLITKQAVLSSEQDLNARQDRLAALKLELSGLGLQRLESQQEIEQQLVARTSELREQERELRELQAQLTQKVMVPSPFAGRVLELLVNRGDLVGAGSPVLSLEIESEELVAVLFVPADQGKQVQKGMEVLISPSNVKQEEFGQLLGRVSWVAEFPSTAPGMKRLLGNDALVNKLMGQGPPIQVDVALVRDPSTTTGFKWTSSRGPEQTITSGTVAAGSVIVRRERPISLVIPLLRSKLGI